MIAEFNYIIKKDTTIKAFLLKQGYNKELLSYIKKEPNKILVNKEKKRIIDKIHKGDVLIIHFQDDKSNVVSSNIPIEIIYQDDNVIAINKEKNIPTHPSVDHYNDTLENGLVNYFHPTPFVCRCVNRLDIDTTGIVLIAKNKLAAYKMNTTKITKKYYAVCLGKINKFGIINKPIYKQGEDYKRVIDPKGKKSITLYKRIKYYKENNYSLVELKLLTGRTHQIRLHLASINHPLIGDKLYYKEDENIARQALHCFYTSYKDPFSKKKVVIKAELPDDMKKLLK